MYRRISRDEGSFYLDILIGFMIFIALTLSFLTIPEVLIKKQELDYIAKTTVRKIERDGMADNDLRLLLLELESDTGLIADVTWSGPFNGASSKIQIRDRFTVSASCIVKIKLLEPMFVEPVYLDIPIRKTISGVSEVYWKDLS